MVGNLSPFLCLLWPACWLGGCQLGLRGSPKGSKKGPQNDPKSIRNPPGRPLACPRVSGGTPQVPPRLPTCIFMHIYAYLCICCAYLCIFMHILCIFMHVFISFMHIYTYCCTCNSFLCIFMHIYAFSNMFMNVYVYLVHICTHLCSLRMCVHIHTYLFMRRRWSAVNEKSCSRATLHRELNICKYAQYKFVSKLYRKHRHTFERWTGMTPWHGGGLGAVRL